MKKSILPILFASLLFLTGTIYSASCFAYGSGSPAAKTGSPGDGSHCVSCHGGSAVNVTGWITTNIPPAGYTAGTVYTITVTATGSGKKGFELSPQNVSGTQLGTLAAGSGSHLVGGTKYVTQSSAGPTSGTSTWSFDWTAPAAGTGNVTLYAAIIVGKLNTKLENITVPENAIIPLAVTASATPSTICEGQTSQLQATGSGGTGTYTYSWTSVPAGFTSTLPNPVVTPSVSTQYNVQVSDGSGSAGGSTNVTVNLPATASAGSNSTVPSVIAPIPLNGTATNYASVLWTTSGSGAFSAANQLTGTYTPSPADLLAIDVTLTLTATPNAPCATPASGNRVIHFDNSSGIGNEPAATLAISPNPSTGVFTVKTGNAGQVSIVVTDLQGKVLRTIAQADVVNGQVRLDLTGTPAGFYMVRVASPHYTLSGKLVIR